MDESAVRAHYAASWLPHASSSRTQHAAELDAAGTTLYVTLATDEHAYGIGAVNVAPPKQQQGRQGEGEVSLLEKVVPMSSGANQMWGMAWHSETSSLVSVQNNMQEGDRKYGALDWRTLDPVAEAWTSNPLANAAYNATLNYTAVWGNLGSVRAYDAGAGVLYTLVAVHRQEKIHIGAVDAAAGALLAASPQLSEGGKPLWVSNGLLQLAQLNE